MAGGALEYVALLTGYRFLLDGRRRPLPPRLALRQPRWRRLADVALASGAEDGRGGAGGEGDAGDWDTAGYEEAAAT